MPSATFYNLPEEKRERLLRAAREEFSRVPYESASVNRIIQSAGIPIVFLTDKQGGSCNPKHRNDSIILPVVLLHYTHYPSPAEGITVAIYKSAGCSRIFKQFFLTPTPDFRLARRNLRMGVHIVYEWRQPVFGHFHIGIKQYHIFGGYLLQGKIISLGKTEIFF